MNDLIQVLYDFVTKKKVGCNYCKNRNERENIYLFIESQQVMSFIEMTGKELDQLIDVYGYDDITLMKGYLTIDIYDMIWYYHNEAKRKEWMKKFKEYAEGLLIETIKERVTEKEVQND